MRFVCCPLVRVVESSFVGISRWLLPFFLVMVVNNGKAAFVHRAQKQSTAMTNKHRPSEQEERIGSTE